MLLSAAFSSCVMVRGVMVVAVLSALAATVITTGCAVCRAARMFAVSACVSLDAG